MLTIGYFADGEWSHRAFQRLIKDKEIKIAFICVRYESTDETLKNYAATHKIPLYRHANINSDEFIAMIKPHNCDLLVSMSFNQIFKEKILSLAPTINCHAGMLPKYRGRNILNWALINDEKEFGISVHFVDCGIDTGDIICQKSYEITDADTYATLLERAFSGCADVLCGAIEKFKSGAVKGTPQPKTGGFYCLQRVDGDENIDWKQTSREIFNFIRAICRPGPMARAFINGVEVKINAAVEVPGAAVYKCVPGGIVGIERDGFLVKTGDSFIKITEWEGAVRLRIGDRFRV